MSRYPQQEEDPLEKQFRILEQEWNYLESVPRHRRSRSADDGLLHKDEILGLSLLDNSPKKLLSSLQQCRSSCSIRQLSAARTGKIEGRNLLEALESVKDDVGDGVSPLCSACSSVLIQAEDSFSCSCSCSLSSFQGSDSSSSLTSLCQGEEAGERRSKEERWVVHTIWIFVTVWMAAMGIIVAMVGFWGEDEYGECITPT